MNIKDKFRTSSGSKSNNNTIITRISIYTTCFFGMSWRRYKNSRYACICITNSRRGDCNTSDSSASTYGYCAKCSRRRGVTKTYCCSAIPNTTVRYYNRGNSPKSRNNCCCRCTNFWFLSNKFNFILEL